jgi:hypothetical protein
MKNILLALVVSSALLVLLIGCEDNSINDPVSAESFNKVGPPNRNTLRGSINLEHKLVDPVRVHNYYLLCGKINYSQLLILKSPQDIALGYDVNLDISVDITLKDILSSLEPSIGKIKSESEDRFYLNANGSYILVKSYPIKSLPDRIELVCTFAVTTEGLKLESVVLNSPVV